MNPKLRSLRVDVARLNDLFSKLYPRRGARVIAKIRKAFALNGTEFGRLFRVSPEAARKWERDGVPPARLPELYSCLDLVKTLRRSYPAARIPAVVRTPIPASEGDTVLQIASSQGYAAAQKAMEPLLHAGNVSAPELAASISLLRRDRKALEERGVQHAAVFGSVARGEATGDSDVDLLVKLDPSAHIGLIQFVDLQEHLRGLFNRNVDLLSQAALHAERDVDILQEAVYAF